jgi:hypothetical protein
VALIGYKGSRTAAIHAMAAAKAPGHQKGHIQEIIGLFP